MYNLCCISNELKENGYNFQTMTWKRYNELCRMATEEYALAELGDRWLNNLIVTRATIAHCRRHGWGYRLSSDLFPILTHPDFKYGIHDVPQRDLITAAFNAIKQDNIGENQVRLSMHPDQFNVLASDNQESVNKTIKELNVHGWIMDAMGCERSYLNPMNIHINCTKGDPADIAARFMSNLNLCDQSVVFRLVVENEDKGIWNVDKLLKYIYQPYKMPITFDNLHHKCNPSEYCLSDLGEDMAMDLCGLTWHSVKPLFHYSESCPNNANRRAHAELPINIPPSDKYDWDVELKGKCYAIRRCEEIRNARFFQDYPLPIEVVN
jgi:UV DNA damage repair endonuclease